MIIQLTSTDPDNIKRFYMNLVTFKKKCINCGQPVEASADMFEYPLEGATLYFECQNCEESFKVKLNCLGGRTIFDFELPDDMEIDRWE
jgi:hypothetical protein